MRILGRTLISAMALAAIFGATDTQADGGSLDDYIDRVGDAPMVADVIAHCPVPPGYEGGASAYEEQIYLNFAIVHVEGDKSEAINVIRQWSEDPSGQAANRCQRDRSIAILGGAPLGGGR